MSIEIVSLERSVGLGGQCDQQMHRFVGSLNHGIYNPIRDHSLKSFELAEHFDARSFPIHCLCSVFP
jgi:hypothetical protein